MTRYEVYLNAFYALLNESRKETGNKDLQALVDGMDPFAYYLEASKDIYIYERFKELWVSQGSTYTPNTDNYGFTFAKRFFSELPKKDNRFKAGYLALTGPITQADWESSAQWQAVSGTYELLFYMLKKAKEPSKDLAAFLVGMDPFSGSSTSLSKDPAIAQAYFKVAYAKPHYEVSYDLARRFIDSLDSQPLNLAFWKVREEEWEALRVDSPHVFRMVEGI